jgi:hypothetical protein
MRVKAIQLGYYGDKKRREGEEFEIDSEKEFSKRWMIKLDKPINKSRSKPEEPKAE